MAASLAADLAAAGPSRLPALRRVESSLRSAVGPASNGADASAEAARARGDWRAFLEAPAADGEWEEEGFALRDSFVNCLVEGCRPGEGEGEGDEDDIFDAISAALRCLSYLVCVRCAEPSNGEGKPKNASAASPIFGPDFVVQIAPDVVQALRLDDGSDAAPTDGVSHAACQLLLALLRPDRPRNEADAATVRDAILVPASSPEAPAGSAACAAEVLGASIAAAVDGAVPPDREGMDASERSMRRENAALARLQEQSGVLRNVGSVCAHLLSEEEGGGAGHPCGVRILGALRALHELGAFAVESQLDAVLKKDEVGAILARLKGEEEQGPETMDEDGRGSDGEAAPMEDALAPIYASIAKTPFVLTTVKDLESMLDAITESLGTTDAELWDERLNALTDLECILAGGVAAMGPEARDLFVERLRKTNLGDQFTDLRSQITQQACRVIVAVAVEFRDYLPEDPQLYQAVCQLVENLAPSILDLCKSGTKLMATQGTTCLLTLAAVSGGYPRLVPRFCAEILGKKVHKNRKRGSVMALTAALRVWDVSCFAKHLDQLADAAKEAATNKDPAVREEGRKMYWALHSSEETEGCAQSMFDGRSREMRTLKKEREGIDAEWAEGGIMNVLSQTGVLGEASEPPAKKPAARPSTAPAKKGVPPRNRQKRPASARLRAEHGTPFKANRLSTPMKSVKDASSVKKRPPPSSGSQQLYSPIVKAPPRKFSESKSANRNAASAAKPPRPSAAAAKSTPAAKAATSPMRLCEGKENSPVATRTPAAKSVGFDVGSPAPASPLMGTPVVNLLARASPLSAEKIQRTGDVLGTILDMLSDRLSPHEQSLGIKALALFAKENSDDPSWKLKFSEVLGCLLDHVRTMPTADFDGPIDFIRSPSKNLSSRDQMQHLFLQAVRSLLQFVPGYVQRDHIKDIVCCMLECTTDAPFDIVHTAERALHNLVTGCADSETCFEHLLPFLSVDLDVSSKINPPSLLSALRTMRYLIDRVSVGTLEKALPSLLPLFHAALGHKSVDMRKATVFVLVEVHFVLGDALRLDEMTASQRRLLDVYIEKHPKKSAMVLEEASNQPTSA
ncbi:hypothetical protein ACHAXT_011162 [Thalassiosira profunda]